MADFGSKKNREFHEDSYTPPSKCMIDGCDCDTTVAVAVVRNETGRKMVGSFSSFSSGKYLRDGFVFDSWITRCAEHYSLDLAKHEGRAPAINWDLLDDEQRKELTEHARIRLREMQNKPFTKARLTSNQAWDDECEQRWMKFAKFIGHPIVRHAA